MRDEYLTEASYDTSPALKKVEKLFGKMQDDVIKFYDAMKKRKMNPKRVNDIYKYYYSSMPDTDGVRFTQYNDDLKEIEDIIKKMFGFRSVRIDFRLYCFYGPHTLPQDKIIFTVPVIRYDGERASITDYADVGSLEKTDDGKVKYRIGYKTELKAGKKGITSDSDSLNLNVNMEMYQDLEPKHYVAILLHEIGHNLDQERLNINIKNDSKMIKVLSTYEKKSTLNPMPSMRILFELLKDRNAKNKKHYTDALSKQMEKIGSSIGYGGNNKRGELFADALPTAYGYGPALIEALQIISPDVRKKDKLDETKGLFSAYKNYTKALIIASRLNSRDANDHGSNLYRLKSVMAQLQKDLNETKDSKMKKRLKENIKELDKILSDIINEKGNSKEMKALLKAWVDNMDVIGSDQDEKKPDIKIESNDESIINESLREEDNYSWLLDKYGYSKKKVTGALVDQVEKDIGYKLPAEYIRLMKYQNGGETVKSEYPSKHKNIWGKNIVWISSFIPLEQIKENTDFMCEEWGYPDIGVNICDSPSGAHNAIFLDYRKSKTNPQVVQIDQEMGYKIAVLAESFDEFIQTMKNGESMNESEVDDSIFSMMESSSEDYGEIKEYCKTQIQKIISDFDDLELNAKVSDTSYSIVFSVTINGKKKQCYELVDDGVISEDDLDRILAQIAKYIRKDSIYKKGEINKISFSATNKSNEDVFQEVFDLIRPVLPQDWEKMILFAGYAIGSYSIKFYYKKDGKCISCFRMHGISRNKLIQLFISIDKILSKERDSLSEKNRWTVMTMIVEGDGKINVNYDYEDHSEDMISFEKNWMKKYL